VKEESKIVLAFFVLKELFDLSGDVGHVRASEGTAGLRMYV
jgi:hypothetical protein